LTQNHCIAEKNDSFYTFLHQIHRGTDGVPIDSVARCQDAILQCALSGLLDAQKTVKDKHMKELKPQNAYHS
jgi:hypothetical protein